MEHTFKVTLAIERVNPLSFEENQVVSKTSTGVFTIDLAILAGKNLRNSAQEFVKIKSSLLLIFSMCLHNQLKFLIPLS